MATATPSKAGLLGYFGLPGSFSHEVAQRSFPRVRTEPFAQQADGFRLLREKRFERIIVPFENSIGGSVPETLDQLILMRDWQEEFLILDQLVYPVNLCLLSRAALAEVTKVYSHFVPLQVVAGWLTQRFPKAQRVLAASTSAAAELAAREEGAAAVGNAAAAKVYGLKVIARNLAPAATNITRFLVVGRRRGGKEPSHRGQQRAMVHLLLPDKPGALADALAVLKRGGVNLSQLLSRPIYGSPGQHQFLLEMDVPRGSELEPVLHKLAKKTALCRLLGIYPVHDVA